MRRLVIRLKPSEQARNWAGDGYRRPSREDLLQLSRANGEHVQACARLIRRCLPEQVEMDVQANLGLLIIMCPEDLDIESLKRKIVAACPNVESVSSDFDLWLVK